MKICIGIISYFPDSDVREVRLEKLNNLLLNCDNLFGLPIIIIAQNWGDTELYKLQNSKIILYNYSERLGITEARRVLRNKFLASEYDYLVMLDDDAVLNCSKNQIEKYLAQIYAHPNMYGVFKKLVLKLFAISKEVYSLIDFPPGGPDTGDYFEDMYLIMALEKLYPERRFIFNRCGIDSQYSNEFSNSTWFWKQYDKHKIGDNTRRMIREL